ncbi:hypothetical protein A2U01_0054865, partial [Trifolium medium]|nr:hypothetical protein [Trifolium medium]
GPMRCGITFPAPMAKAQAGLSSSSTGLQVWSVTSSFVMISDLTAVRLHLA